MASYAECVAIIQKAAGDTITKEQAEALLQQIDDITQLKKNEGGLEAANSLVQEHLNQVSAAMKMEAMIAKRASLMNVVIHDNALTQIKNFKNPSEGLSALLVGSVKSNKGAKLSVDARVKAISNEYVGKLVHDLEKGNLLEAFASGKLDREIAKELWQLPDGKEPISGSPEAYRIAKIISNYQNDLVARQNRAGAWIRLLPGYIVRQTHDMFNIRKAGKEAWINSVLPKLDVEKTFGTLAPEKYREFLAGAYDGLATGIHYRAKGAQEQDASYVLLGFKGPKNLAKKVSQERILHFKSADDWMDYSAEFGRVNLRDAVINGLQHGSRNLALLQTLGSNPKAMVERLLADIRKGSKGDVEAIDKLSELKIMNQFKELDGTTSIPDGVSLAKVSAGIRTVQNLSKLGASLISSITDIPFQVAEMKYQGVPLLEAWWNALWNPFAGRRTGFDREVAQLLGAGIQGILGDVHSRFDADDGFPGTMSKLQQRFFKLNGMNYWNDAHLAGVSLLMSSNFANHSQKTWGSVPPELKNLMQQYNLGEREWPVMQAAVHKVDDSAYMMPDEVLNLPDALLGKYLGISTSEASGPAYTRKIRNAKEDISVKMRTMYTDRMYTAIPHPGAAERAIMLQGTQPGTALGEALRLFMQFKSFPISVIRKGVGREIYGSGADSIKEALFKGKGDMLGLVHLMVTTTLFGYAAMTIKDLIKGREPRGSTELDPAQIAKLVGSAMAQGGGLGIYGDFLFGEFSRYGRSFTATMAGPSLGQMDDLAEIYTRLRNGDDAAAQVVRQAINNTPFINMFYTRSAIDYLFLYQLQEMVSPGYLHRLEARIKTENDQSFYMPPSSMIPYGGGDKLLESVR
jgi:hypothetical protein